MRLRAISAAARQGRSARSRWRGRSSATRSGTADFEYFADGSWSLTAVGGHFGAGLHPGDDPERGFFVVTGSQYVLSSDPDGHRTLTSGHGTVENLCDTLA